MLLIKNCEIYSPEYLGQKDILICGDKIIYISHNIAVPNSNFPEIDVIDGSDLIAVPGIIDAHVHINGAGGEGGFTTRTPEMVLTDFTRHGVTTCVGLLGTDGTTRSMGGLIAKARALDIEGINTYAWTGSYEVPTRTVTNSAREDIILVDKIIGIGEIAISDHRGSHPSEKDIIHLACEARVGGMISGKCGILHLHVGDGSGALKPVFHMIKGTEIPFENVLPTHINRNKRLFTEGVEYAKMGGYVDITTSIRHDDDDALDPEVAYSIMLKHGVCPYNITMTSDAGGSLPIFDERGKLQKLTVGSLNSNIETIRLCIKNHMSIEEALIPFTSSPAKLLKFNGKGNVKEDYDADIILMDKNFNINTVICKGKIMVKEYKPVIYGTFEKEQL